MIQRNFCAGKYERLPKGAGLPQKNNGILSAYEEARKGGMISTGSAADAWFEAPRCNL